MDKRCRKLQPFVLTCILGAILTTTALLPVGAAPMSARSAQQLAQAGFVPQNKSDVERLRRAGIGWSALRATMLKSGASKVEVDSALKHARREMARRFEFNAPQAAPLWPVFARPALLGARRVWIIEAATPRPLFFNCPTGATPESLARMKAQNEQRCFARVLVVQTRQPCTVLARYDTMQ